MGEVGAVGCLLGRLRELSLPAGFRLSFACVEKRRALYSLRDRNGREFVGTIAEVGRYLEVRAEREWRSRMRDPPHKSRSE